MAKREQAQIRARFTPIAPDETIGAAHSDTDGVRRHGPEPI